MFVKKKVRGKSGRFSANAGDLPFLCSSCAIKCGSRAINDQTREVIIKSRARGIAQWRRWDKGPVPLSTKKRRLPAFMQKAFSFAQGHGTRPLVPLLLADGGRLSVFDTVVDFVFFHAGQAFDTFVVCHES